MATTQEPAGARPARETLAWSRETVEPALRAAVDRLPDRVRQVAGSHFGGLDEQGRPAGVDGGRAIHSALVLPAADAAAGSTGRRPRGSDARADGR